MATNNTVINDTTIGSVAERFRVAVEVLDTEAVLDLVADDVRLFSPVPRRPFEGKEMLGVVFGFLRTVITDPVFRSVLYGEGEAVLRFEGTLAGETCEWTHHLEIGSDGVITSITDQLRPLSAVLALQAAADRHFGVTTGGDDVASVQLETGPDPTRAFMEQAYEAYAAYDIDAIINLFADDVVFHVAGRHPLAGDLHGPDAVLGYLAAVASTGGGRGGFNVRSLLTDGELGVAVVDGTAHDRERVFTRPIIHIFRVVDGHLAEYWDNPFDQYAEDEFWTTAAGDQPGSQSPNGEPAAAGTLEERLLALFVELEPADQDALLVMCGRAAVEDPTVDDPAVDVEGFSGLQGAIVRLPVPNLSFGGDLLRLQQANETSNRVSGNVVRAIQRRASTNDGIIGQMR